MSVFGSLEVVVQSNGDVLATVSMDDGRFGLEENNLNQLYAVEWLMNRNEKTRQFSSVPHFKIGNVKSSAFPKDTIIEFTGFARTRRLNWRPIRLTIFREIAPHFILPPISSAFVEQLEAEDDDSSGADKSVNWLVPVLHQMMD